MRNYLLVIGTMFFALSVHCQNFVGATKSSDGQTITLANDEVLEIKLPCNPSTGYGWYLTSSSQQSAVSYQQIGDWEFIPDNNNGMVGQPGTEVIRFTGVSKGTSELTLEYKRPWEKDKPSVDKFKLTIISNGKYTGTTDVIMRQCDNVIMKKKSAHQHVITSTPSLPSPFSWQSYCTPIKDQGECGCCWAFAATGCFEAVINIIDTNITSLSEQWLINCATPMSEYYGCQGATSCPNNYWVSPGAVYDSELSYTDGNCGSGTCIGTCGTSYTYHEKADTSEYVNGSSPTVDQIKQAIYNYGPVWVAVDAGTSTFENYSGGIYTADDGTTITDHAVVLVGWKDSTVSSSISGYWILRNSWGISWGEHGYMRIGYGVNTVGSDADYIIYKGGIPCSGITPTPGNTVSSVNPTCFYESFTLSLQNFANRVKYQWQSSPDSSTWTNISGAIYSNFALQTDTITYYRCEVTCSGDTGTSNALKETAIHPPTPPPAGTQIASGNQIIWNWEPIPWVTGYKWNTINDYNTAIGNGTSTSYTQTGLTSNSQYSLYVWSYNICGNSAVVTLKQNTTMGVDELRMEKGELKIYPNPVTNELIIETNSNSLFNINLTNIIGQSIYTIYDLRFTIYKIDMKNLVSGMYLLKICNEKEVVVRKIMKE